jgi:uncharacterized iron-regulated membrane protein
LTRNWIYKWHKKIAILSSLALLILTVTGSILVYKLEIIKTLVASDLNFKASLNVQLLSNDLDQIFDDWNSEDITLVKVPNENEPYWSIYLKDQDKVLLRHDDLTPLNENLWIITATEFIRELHVSLFIGLTGHVVAFLVGLLVIFIILSGLYLWLPTWRRFNLKSLFSKASSRGKTIVHHKNLGFFIILGLLILIFTGTMMHGVRLYGWVFPAEKVSKESQAENFSGSLLSTKTLLEIAQKSVPNSTPSYIWMPTEKYPIAKFRMKFKDEWHMNGKTVVTLDATNGEILLLNRSDKAPLLARFLYMMWPLHSAYGLSTFYSFFLFLMSLGLVRLLYTGLYSWWLSHDKKQ